jgi:thioredoxin reductase (NADPH)
MVNETAQNETLDVAIIGGGPIGLELAMACAKSGLRYTVYEAGQIGNTIFWWAPQTRWFSSNDRISIGGVPLETVDQNKSTREEFLNYLRSVVRQFNLRIETGRRVQSVLRNDDGVFLIHFESPHQDLVVRSRYVVLAIGGTDHPNNLNIPGEDLPHVDSYFREPHTYFNRRVVIIGGRNSAVEAALRASKCGADVTLCYRGSDLPRQSIKYWLLPEIDGLIRSGTIKAHFNTVPVEITPTHVTLRKLCANGQSDDTANEPIKIPADNVLSLIGYYQDKRLFQACGVNLIGETQRPQFDESTMMTNIPGLFVAGTAVAGTQSSRYKIFLENCHVHVARILSTITGGDIAAFEAQIAAQKFDEFQARIEAMPES